MRRAAAAGFKAVPTGIDHGTVTVVIDGRPFEVTTLREDVETFGRQATVRVRARLEARRRAARLHHERAVALARRHGARLCRRARRSRGAPRALHRRAGNAHRRGLSAHPALLPLPRLLRRGRARRRRPACRDRRARRARAAVARARAHGADEAAARAARGAGARRDGGSRPARARCSAACRISASFANMAKVEAALGLAPDAARRLGALGVWIVEDAERLWQRLRLSNAEHERLAAMATDWWRVSPAMGEARRVRCSIGSGRSTSSSACCSPGRARRRRAHDPAWRDLATCRSAGPRRRFRCARRISSRAASRRARRSARRSAAPRKPGSRPAFRWTGKRSMRSPMRRWR